MDDLIEALQIFSNYTNTRNPTNCEHDIMYIMDVHKDDLDFNDQQRIEELDFIWDDEEEVFFSFRFGSA